MVSTVLCFKDLAGVLVFLPPFDERSLDLVRVLRVTQRLGRALTGEVPDLFLASMDSDFDGIVLSLWDYEDDE